MKQPATNNFGFVSSIFTLLQISDTAILQNLAKVTGEEVSLRGLFEIRRGNGQFDCAEHGFGTDSSAQSTTYSWLINYVHRCLKHLGCDNLDLWIQN
jgi:hypothetical protein